MQHLCVYTNLPCHGHGHRPSSGQELGPSVSQLVGLGGWHDRGGWPGLGARVELGGLVRIARSGS